MHRCFLESSLWTSGTVVLPRDESRHLLQVLRANKDDAVALFDGVGTEADARIVGVDQQAVTLEIVKSRKVARPQVALTLLQALPKGRRMDLIVEKCTELGVSEITPVITERTVTRLKPQQCAAREERWLRLAQSAAKQCGTPWIPSINPVTTYAEALTACGSFDAILVGTLGPGTIPLQNAIHDLKQRSPSRIAFLVGPEGDLAADEVKAVCSCGGIAVTFGKLVLRVETAALYAMSVLNYEFMDGGPLQSA